MHEPSSCPRFYGQFHDFEANMKRSISYLLTFTTAAALSVGPVEAQPRPGGGPGGPRPGGGPGGGARGPVVRPSIGMPGGGARPGGGLPRSGGGVPKIGGPAAKPGGRPAPGGIGGPGGVQQFLGMDPSKIGGLDPRTTPFSPEWFAQRPDAFPFKSAQTDAVA
ncbi:MAG: hypothetical protein ACRC1K_26575, partial [Planctomycetia bacterium]